MAEWLIRYMGSSLENQKKPIKMFTNAKNIVNIYNCDSVVLPHLFAMQ